MSRSADGRFGEPTQEVSSRMEASTADAGGPLVVMGWARVMLLLPTPPPAPPPSDAAVAAAAVSPTAAPPSSPPATPPGSDGDRTTARS